MDGLIDWQYWYDKLIRSYQQGQPIRDLDTAYYLYRYVSSDLELDFVRRTRMVFSTNPSGTYWTTLYTDDAVEAQRLLALRTPPRYRIGGVPVVSVDRSLIRYQGRVRPNNGQPGGAWEVVLTGPVAILSVFDLRNMGYITF